ncbi:ATP-binding cassette domain-containing protein [Rhodobacteraceae bacterium]|nr:ATP-binding cassette domain-containing protein [Paracoccaceae bacterium]
MKPLWKVFWLLLCAERVSLLRGGALSLIVLAMGAALLGLSGWFITAAAAAGMAGAGAVFDVFRPSAMVRFLALFRAAARYGERLLTHDATLRGLEVVRHRLLSGFLQAPYARMIQIRGAQALNRLTADVDALDGVTLRLILPVMAGAATHIIVFAVLWWLVNWQIAAWIFVGYIIGAGTILWRMAKAGAGVSRKAEAAGQAFRSRFVDLIRARRDLAVYGRLPQQRAHVLDAETRRRAELAAQDRAERNAGFALNLLIQGVAAGALGLGAAQVGAGTVTPAFAALGFFAALGLAETLGPMRRIVSDLGRMREAARRVTRDIAPVDVIMPNAVDQMSRPATPAPRLPLQMFNVSLRRPGTQTIAVKGIDLQVRAGQTVALTGPSGAGKSTLLLAAAGLQAPCSGQITIDGRNVHTMPEAALRDMLTLLPQRSTLIAGTLRDVLRMGCDAASDAELWAALHACQLAPLIEARGGLDLWVGSRGEGFSGGEVRRIALARALLRKPQVLLLDEPTEGLDHTTAVAVLHAVRQRLPQAAILMASHRVAEIEVADHVIHITKNL